MNLKQKTYAQCQALIGSKLHAHQQVLKELIASAASETKSSAGDKFETGRAMLHIEQDNIRRQEAETMAQKAVLDAIDPNSHHERIGLGSLVKTTGGYYFLSTALGKITVEGQVVIALSVQSPLGSKLMGLGVGSIVVMNGKELIVEEVE